MRSGTVIKKKMVTKKISHTFKRILNKDGLSDPYHSTTQYLEFNSNMEYIKNEGGQFIPVPKQKIQF